MKRILCFGDSNTHGFTPITMERFEKEIRWTGILQKKLGDKYTIIEEGLNGRTTDLEDDTTYGKNGLAYLAPCLMSQEPLDILILMLGTNDIKKKFHRTADEIAKGMKNVIDEARKVLYMLEGKTIYTKIVLISPLFITEDLNKGPFGEEFDFENGIKKSRMLEILYEKLAKEEDIFFWAPSEKIQASNEDGIHMDRSGHKEFAEALVLYLIQNKLV